MKAETAPSPEWLTCCAEPHADEVAMLRDHLGHREREITRMRDRWSIDQRERDRRDREVMAAAKKAAWDHCLWALKNYVLAEAKQPLYDLVHAAEKAIASGKPQDADAFAAQWAARDLRAVLGSIDNPLAEPSGVLAELVRLRAVVAEQCARLHRDSAAADGGGTCRCAGCEMTRAVHGVTP